MSGSAEVVSLLTRRLDRSRSALQGFRRRSATQTAAIITVVVLLVLIFPVPWLLSLDPYAIHLDHQLEPPSLAFPFGTDDLGRDYLARVLYGGRVSVVVAVLVVALAAVVGIAIGGAAGLAGGVIDEAFMRIADIFLAFPSILLALVIVAAFGPSIPNAVFAVALAWWPAYARIVRGQVLLVRELDYVTATRVVGASPLRLLRRTILPNSVGPLRQIVLLDVGYAVVAFATLSYFGLGVQPPDPEWGVLIRDATQYVGGWWTVAFPGLAILIFATAVNLAGGDLRRRPRERRS